MGIIADMINAHPASLLQSRRTERFVLADYGSVLGYNMHNIRIVTGYSQALLAKKTGLNLTYVGQVERSQENISLKNIVLIAKAFDAHPAALLLTKRPK